MRYISIEQAKPKMILASSVYNNSGKILLGINTILTDDYINKMKKRGLPGIYIEDELAKDIQIKSTITEELRNEGVQAIRECNVDSAMNVAKKIVDQILQNPSVTLDMVDLRTYDDYTYRHSVNVAVISTIIGINMQLNVNRVKELATAAILHDIGKSLIDAKIINKPGRLTDKEYEEVQKHSHYAYQLLQHRLDLSSQIRHSVLSHHENEDGTGYPNGLKGDQIHIYAKIIHVADVFDALVSKRPYKDAHARAEAVEYLMGACNRFFDEDVVKAFMHSVSIYPKGTTVALSNGKEALIVDNTESILRPRIRLLEDGTEMDLSSLNDYRDITILSNGEIPR